MKKEDIHEELSGLSPLLGNLKKERDGMSVPPDYFSKLQESVMQRLEDEGAIIPESSRPFWRISVNRRWLATAAAAVVTLLMAAWWWMQPTEKAGQPGMAATVEMVQDSITSADMEMYVKENILEFDEEMLATAFDEETAPENASTTPNDKSVKKTKEHSEEVENVLDDLTEEELEDLL